MKRIFILLLFLSRGWVLLAQQNYFVYIQTDNKQPFYVRTNEKLYSSSTSGYLIIPRLQAANYIFKIGFPKSEWQEQILPVTITNTDLGFSLQNFGDKGWGLLNLQSLKLEMASNMNKPAENEAATNNQDAFANTLADIVNTPSIKEKKKEVKAEPNKELPIEASVNEPQQETVKSAAEVNEVKPSNKEVQSPAGTTSTIQKIFAANDDGGTSFIYTVMNDAQIDTVRVFIPIKNEKRAEKSKPDNNIPAESTVEKEIPATPEKSKQTDSRFLDIELENPNTKKVDTTQLHENETVKTEIPASGLTYNSDCKAEATQADFLKARKNMASEETDENMIAQAIKMFKQKCYSTEQVKNLGLLFLTDEGRFKLFQAAYPFVHDTQYFGTLINQLTDEEYVSRFKKLQNKK